MMKIKNRGFTLIELLVVIAVLGILMGVTIVAINPTARINEAKDANRQAAAAQIGQAMEVCYTKYEGSYSNCNTVTKLLSGGFLKNNPAANAGGTWTCSGGCVAGTGAGGKCATTSYWKYSGGQVKCETSNCGSTSCW